jgi:hypothetical protein
MESTVKLFALFVLISSSIADAQVDQLSDAELKEKLHKLKGAGVRGLDYKQARVQMFNRIYLERDENDFFNRDVYCGTKHYRTFPRKARARSFRTTR